MSQLSTKLPPPIIMETATDDNNNNDPLLKLPSNIVRDGDYVILAFADGRQMFAQARSERSFRGKHAPFKFQKKAFPTYNLIGLPYGTVLEINMSSAGLIPLPEGEDVVPKYPDIINNNNKDSGNNNNNSGSSTAIKTDLEDDNEANADDNTFPTPTTETEKTETTASKVAETTDSAKSTNNQQMNDNRRLFDDNKSQQLDSTQIEKMIDDGAHGSEIVSKLIQNSASFGQKTTFSQAKYIARKQRKYQPRCRIVRSTPLSVCELFFRTKPKQLLNMREDTLGQILSYSNICAGCQVLVYEHCMGVLTGSIAQRMGGYGQVLSLYENHQPSCTEMLQKFNLSFAEHQSIKWIHAGDVFGRHDDDKESAAAASSQDDNTNDNDIKDDGDDPDPEKTERDALTWPIALQDHTRRYLESMKTEKDQKSFLKKRCARFARKLTRNTSVECNEFLFGSTKATNSSENSSSVSQPRKWTRKCDSIILAVGQYDPTLVLLDLWEFLAPSSPFVIYCEYIEPLTECFNALQRDKLAINLRLSDTWMREYQVLPGRTHPSMNMTQSGGFLLVGIKLDPVHGHNEIDEELAKEIRLQIGGRRGKRKKRKSDDGDEAETSEEKNVDSDNSKKPRTTT